MVNYMFIMLDCLGIIFVKYRIWYILNTNCLTLRGLNFFRSELMIATFCLIYVGFDHAIVVNACRNGLN